MNVPSRTVVTVSNDTTLFVPVKRRVAQQQHRQNDSLNNSNTAVEIGGNAAEAMEDDSSE